MSEVVVVAVVVVATFLVVVVIDVVVVISSAHIKLLPEVPQVILFGQVYSETKSLTAVSLPCDPGVLLITQCPFSPCHIHHKNCSGALSKTGAFSLILEVVIKLC